MVDENNFPETKESKHPDNETELEKKAKELEEVQ